MQTFLPYANFTETAAVLDNKRLGNQCYRECKTLFNGGWKNHPASKMWQGYEYYLALYARELAREMKHRPSWKNKKSANKWFEYWDEKMKDTTNNGPPPWLGSEDFHASHRSKLLEKDPEWYGQFGWTEDPGEEYIWPS